MHLTSLFNKMDDETFSTTLAYTKSPKASRRTTFQDELKKAVSARANKHSYSDDFDIDDDEEDDKNDDDDDDILNLLLKRQKQKKERFKTGRTKGKINDFKLSDDEEENVKPKKVSFMKTKRTSSPVHFQQLNSMGSADGQHSSFHSTQSRNTSPNNSYTEKNQQSDSHFSSLSDKFHPESSLLQKDEQSMRLRNQTESLGRKSLSESPLPLNSENSQWESSIPLTSEGSQWDSPAPLLSEKDEDNQTIGEDGDLPIPQPRERSVKPKLSTGHLVQDMSPRPKPRQRTANLCDTGQLEEETQAETPAFSRTATSSISIPFSNRSSSEKSHTSTNDSQGPDEHKAMSEMSNTQSCSTAEQVFEAPATADSVASEESKERDLSASFEEKHESSQDDLDHTSTTQSRMSRKSTDRPPSSRSSSSRKSKSTYIVESKYLGTLKILDQRTQETQQVPEAADALRAAVYQEWLKKKEETLKITRRAKKQEEKLKEEKIQEEKLTKIADAKASYDAWKEKKSEVIKKKVQEKQEAINRQQLEMDKKQEKRETAKQQVFEKWKEEHDSVLKDRIKEKKQTERKEKRQQVREKEERKKDSTSAFTEWSDRKKDAIEEKVRAERRKEKIKEVEEEYEKEEKEKMALEMYNKWLTRKEFQQKRERSEKRIQAILRDDPPPPWSPPNKTIPFGK